MCKCVSKCQLGLNKPGAHHECSSAKVGNDLEGKKEASEKLVAFI